MTNIDTAPIFREFADAFPDAPISVVNNMVTFIIDIFTPATTKVSPLVGFYIANGQNIHAIKEVRIDNDGMGLKAAKDIVDALKADFDKLGVKDSSPAAVQAKEDLESDKALLQMCENCGVTGPLYASHDDVGYWHHDWCMLSNATY